MHDFVACVVQYLLNYLSADLAFFFFSGNLSKQPSELELTKPILGLQPRDKAAMLVVKTKEIFSAKFASK